jgi:O-antigen/teichoic acid export membrane protein
MPSNTARIAKNTLALYFRQVLIMLVSLYTVRVILNTLGAEDYGIYQVTAGVVTMFGFLSGSMATASQRYFSFELGRGDLEQLKKVFSLSLLIYIMIGVVIVLLGETAGLWFVNRKLTIPLERRGPALWVYQFSIISFLFTIMTSPYMAMIIAHEDMNIYAYVSIGEALLKLGVAFLLRAISWDKLTLYGILMLTVVATVTAIYRVICIKKYKECKFSFYWNKDLFREIAGYSGWNMFGASVGIFKNQIVNIMLNQFFNPVVVAARSLAIMVDSAVMSFSQNFNNAIRPQIIKNYASGQKEKMLSLMFRGSKGTYLLMYLFVLPFALEMPMVLRLWLKNPPEYAVLFTRLMLFDVLINSISYPIMTAAQATGKIRLYQAVVGGILLLNVPVSGIALLMGAPAYSVMIAAIILTFMATVSRLLILKRLIDYSIRQFMKQVIIPVCVISVLSAVLPVILCYFLPQNIIRLCLVLALGIISVGIYSYFIALDKRERQKIKNLVSKYIVLRDK